GHTRCYRGWSSDVCSSDLRSGLGRAMKAVRDNEPAAATLSVSPRRVKLTAFVLAGMIAAFAGYLYGGLLVSFADPNTFAPELSLALVALVILGGVTTVTGPIAGGVVVLGAGYILLPILPNVLGPNIYLVISGVGLFAAVISFPGGIAQVLFDARDQLVRRLGLVGEEGPEPDEVISVRPRLEPAT